MVVSWEASEEEVEFRSCEMGGEMRCQEKRDGRGGGEGVGWKEGEEELMRQEILRGKRGGGLDDVGGDSIRGGEVFSCETSKEEGVESRGFV